MTEGLSRRSLAALHSLSEDLTELSPTAMPGFGTMEPLALRLIHSFGQCFLRWDSNPQMV